MLVATNWVRFFKSLFPRHLLGHPRVATYSPRDILYHKLSDLSSYIFHFPAASVRRGFRQEDDRILEQRRVEGGLDDHPLKNRAGLAGGLGAFADE